MKRSQTLQHWWSFVNVMQSCILLYVSLHRILHSCGGITIRSTDSRLKLLTYRNDFTYFLIDQSMVNFQFEGFVDTVTFFINLK